MPEVSLGYRGERGVETKGLLSGNLSAEINQFFGGFAGVRFSLGQQGGIATYNAGLSLRYPTISRLNCQLGFQHEEWPAWRVGENRAYAFLEAILKEGIKFGLGIARRQTIFNEARFHEPWLWRGAVGEWNFLYRLSFRFLEWKNSTFTYYFANFDNFTLHNPQQLPFGIRLDYSLSPLWKVFTRCGSAVNGVSTMLLSFSEFSAEIGVRYAR